MNTQELQLAIVEARREVSRLLCRVTLLEGDLADTELELRDAYEEWERLEGME